MRLLQERCLLVVHPDAETQNEIAETVQSLGRRILTAPDLPSASEMIAGRRVGVVIIAAHGDTLGSPEIDRLRRVTVSRIPAVLLTEKTVHVAGDEFDDRSRADQLVWPRDRHLLPGTVRTYLRILEQSDSLDHESENFVDELRRTGGDARKREVFDALQETSGNISKAADLLGLSRGGLQHRMRKFGIAAGKR